MDLSLATHPGNYVAARLTTPTGSLTGRYPHPKPPMPDHNYKALCAELVDIATAHCNPDDSAVGYCAAVLARARAALARPEPEILPKNCWLDDEPDIWPSPCVFEDPEEAISNCAHASVLHSEGKCKTDCQHYRQPTSGSI